MYLLLAIEIGVTANNSVRLWGCTTLKIGKPSRIYPGSHRNLLPSFLGTDPWSIVINVNDHLRNGPGISADPWSYQVDIPVPTMDLSADRTWDQSTRRRR